MSEQDKNVSVEQTEQRQEADGNADLSVFVEQLLGDMVSFTYTNTDYKILPHQKHNFNLLWKLCTNIDTI